MTADPEEKEEEWTERGGGRVCIIRPFKTTMINEGDKAREERGREAAAVKKGTRRRRSAAATKLHTT